MVYVQRLCWPTPEPLTSVTSETPTNHSGRFRESARYANAFSTGAPISMLLVILGMLSSSFVAETFPLTSALTRTRDGKPIYT